MPDRWRPDLKEIHRAATSALKGWRHARPKPLSGPESVERDGFLTMMGAMVDPNKIAAVSPNARFANLPEKKAGRGGAGITAAKMKGCRWLKPSLVWQFEFVEWTEDAICASYRTSSSFHNTTSPKI